MSWEAVAADLGAGRSGEQCRNKWRRMRLRPEPDSEAAERPEEAGVEGEAEPGRRRQPRQGYRSWSEEEADTAAQLLGAVGARLAADSSFELTARSLPAKLEAAVSLGWAGLEWSGLEQCVLALAARLTATLRNLACLLPVPC